MKKFIILLSLLIVGNISLSEDLSLIENFDKNVQNTVFKCEIVFDWLNISQKDRDLAIEQYKNELFPENTIYKYNKKDFKNEYKQYSRDMDYKRHYRLVTNNVKETDTENLCGFYKGNLLVSYAIQFKDDLKTVYYYDTLGHLRYIDILSENYPNFPYTSKQYRADGTLVSAILFKSHDLQYMYSGNQTFKGAWYKNQMYNRKAKPTITRTNW